MSSGVGRRFRGSGASGPRFQAIEIADEDEVALDEHWTFSIFLIAMFPARSDRGPCLCGTAPRSDDSAMSSSKCGRQSFWVASTSGGRRLAAKDAATPLRNWTYWPPRRA